MLAGDQPSALHPLTVSLPVFTFSIVLLYIVQVYLMIPEKRGHVQ